MKRDIGQDGPYGGQRRLRTSHRLPGIPRDKIVLPLSFRTAAWLEAYGKSILPKETAKGLPPSFEQLPGDACLATENGCENNNNNNNNNNNTGGKNEGIFIARNNSTIMHTKFPEDLNQWFVSSPAGPSAARDQPSPRVQAHQGHVAMPKDSSAPPTDPLIARLPLLDQAVSPRRACDDAEGPDAAALSDHNEHTACQISEGGESPSLPTQQSLPRPRTPQTSTKNHSNTAIHPTLPSTSSSSSLSGVLLRDTRAPQGGAAMMSDADLGDNQASRATMATVKDPGHVPPSLQNNMMASGSGLRAKGGVMRRILYPPDGGGLRPRKSVSWSTDPDEERIYVATASGPQSAAPSGQSALSGQMMMMDIDVDEDDGAVETSSGLGLLAAAASMLEGTDA